MRRWRTVSAGEAVYRKVARRLIPILMICYILNFIDRTNIGLAKLAFMPDLGMTEAMYGLGAGLFYIGYTVCEIPSNFMLKRIGARLTLLRIMVAWGLCAAAFAFMRNAVDYYVLRTLLGVAEAGFFPGMLLFISFWIPQARRARFTALFMSAMAISGIVSGPLSAAIMTGFEGVAGWPGWRWMFLVEGLPSVAMGVVAFLMLADQPAKAKWLTDEDKATLAAEFARETAIQPAAARHHHFRTAMQDPRLYSMAAMSVSLIAGGAGLVLWAPTVLRQSGVSSVTTIGWLLAVPYVVAIFVQQFVARRSDRLQERRWHSAIPAFIGALGWLLLIISDHRPALAMSALTMIAVGFLGATGPFWAMPSRYLTGTAAAGGLALITMAGGIGSFLSPVLVGYLATKTGSLTGGYAYYAALMALGPLAMLYGTRRIERSRADSPDEIVYDPDHSRSG